MPPCPTGNIRPREVFEGTHSFTCKAPAEASLVVIICHIGAGWISIPQ